MPESNSKKSSLRDSKLILLLQSFDNKQLKRLEKFLLSPYFNDNEHVLALFQYIVRFAPEYDDERLSKKNIFCSLFAGKPYKDIKIRQLMTELFKLVEKFIAHSSLEQSEIQKHLLLLDFYLDMNLPKYFQASLRSAQKVQLKRVTKNAPFHYDEFLLADRYSTYLSFEQQKLKGGRNLQQVIDKFQTYYLIQMAQYVCGAINRSLSHNVTFNLRLIDELLTQLAKEQYKDIPSIQVYYQILLLLTVSEKASLDKLIELFETYSSIFQPDERRFVYRYMLNYCISKMNNGEDHYYTKVFELYQIGLQKEVLFREGKIPSSTYKNIVTTGLRLEKFDVIEQFIGNYKNDISADYPKDVYHYNLAHLFFYEAKYDDAIELLNTIEYNDIFYKIDVRKLLIKIYYERGDYLLLDSSMNAFRVFIHRNTVISPHHKATNQNFINFLYKIIRIAPDDLDKIKEIKEEIDETQNIAERKWLVEKLDALL